MRFPLREFVLLPIIALAIFTGLLLSPAFLTVDNMINILQQSSELSILVLAESMILIGGKFDLSLESIVGFAPMVDAWSIDRDVAQGGSGIGLDGYLGIVAIFIVGGMIGLVNGLLVVKLRLNAFISTLAMLILLRGTTVDGLEDPIAFDAHDGDPRREVDFNGRRGIRTLSFLSLHHVSDSGRCNGRFRREQKQTVLLLCPVRPVQLTAAMLSRRQPCDATASGAIRAKGNLVADQAASGVAGQLRDPLAQVLTRPQCVSRERFHYSRVGASRRPSG